MPQPWVWLKIPAFSLMPGLNTTARITSTGALWKGGAHSINPYGVASFSWTVSRQVSACSGVAAPLITAQTLGIKINLSLFKVFRAVNNAVFRNCPDEPFAIPGYSLDGQIKLVALLNGPGAIFVQSEPGGDFCQEG